MKGPKHCSPLLRHCVSQEGLHAFLPLNTLVLGKLKGVIGTVVEKTGVRC
jgi:hypothetical protein